MIQMGKGCMTYKEAFRILNDYRYVDAMAKVAFENEIYVKYSSLKEAKEAVKAAHHLAVITMREKAFGL